MGGETPVPCHPSVWLTLPSERAGHGRSSTWRAWSMSGIVRLAAGIEAERARRLPRQRKTQRGKLALLVATMLSERSANLMDLAAAVPRPAERTDMRYQWIARLLADPRLDGDAVMQPFAEAAILHTGAAGGTVVLILGQSKVSARHQVLMLSVRVGERALPLAWRVRETRGSIGFVEQRELLTVVASWLPAGTRIVLMGDRFYGSPDLIALCRKLGWGWRLRLKQELLVFEGGGETTLAACFAGGRHMLSGIELTARRIWPDTFVTEANLTQNVSSLRKVLGERANDHRYVVTVPGRGYSFVAEVIEIPRESTGEFTIPAASLTADPPPPPPSPPAPIPAVSTATVTVPAPTPVVPAPA